MKAQVSQRPEGLPPSQPTRPEKALSSRGSGGVWAGLGLGPLLPSAMCSSPTTCRRKLVLGSSGKAQRTSAWTGGPFRAASISRTWALRPLPTASLERPGTVTPQAKQQEAAHPAPGQLDPRACLGDAAGRGPAAARTAGRGWCRHWASHDTLPGPGVSAPAEAAPPKTHMQAHTQIHVHGKHVLSVYKPKGHCAYTPQAGAIPGVHTCPGTLGAPLPLSPPGSHIHSL